MSDLYLFGRDILRQFIPTENGQPISDVPSQSPAIYLFTSKPGRAAAAAGTGSFASISSWTALSAHPYGFVYSIDAIDDPEPNSEAKEREYWEAINFTLSTSEQTQTIIRSFLVVRAEGLTSHPRVKAHDLKTLSPNLEDVIDDDTLTDFIRAAEFHVRLELEAKGYRLEQLRNLEDLKLPITYKALELAYLDQYGRPDDIFDRGAKSYERMYRELMTNLKLPFDPGADGSAEIEADLNPGYYITLK